MTAKEKAKELSDKMMFGITWVNSQDVMNKAAKECALIAVDEIINYLKSFNDSFENTSSEDSWEGVYFSTSNEVVFWQQVKEEIENL